MSYSFLCMAPALAKDLERQRRLEGLLASLHSDVRAMREVQVRVGRTLLEIRRGGDLTVIGTTTFPIFCEGAGLSPTEARELTAMAEAAEASPEVETRVVEARITPQKARVVNEILKTPELQVPGEDPLQLAESKFSKDLVDELKRRKEEARIQEPPVSMNIVVSRKGRDDFRRCQTLVSRSNNRWASEGETLERISDEFLQRHDPERRAKRFEEKDKTKASLRAGASSRPPQGAVAVDRSRHVPATDSRELDRVCGDRCWIDGCPNEAYLQFAHRTPFRRNGSNRAINLIRVCFDHHRQFDSGTWTPIVRRDGEVVLIDRRGVRVGQLRPEAARFVASQGRAPP